MGKRVSKIFIPLFVLVAYIFVTGCPSPQIHLPDIVKPRPKVGLVLSGGASRGFAHVGVIKVLEEEGIPIDLIVGTSAGSLTGALYAYFKNGQILEREARSLKVEDVFDFSIFSIGVGVVKGERIIRFVEDKIKVKNIEELKIPFAAVATDLNTGRKVVFRRGSISKAIRASTSIPGIFIPLVSGGQILVDGGVVDSLPVDVAREMGADIVIAVDVTAGSTNFEIKNVVDIIIQTFNIMGSEINKYKAEEADVVIRPDVGGLGIIDFSQKDYLILQGERAARKAIPAIREAIERK